MVLVVVVVAVAMVMEKMMVARHLTCGFLKAPVLGMRTRS